MYVQIQLPDELAAELDRRVGRRSRSAFIARALERALEDERRWDAIVASFGSIAKRGHEWDEDAADWVRLQRHGNPC